MIYGASFVEWFAEEGKRTYGEHPQPGLDEAPAGHQAADWRLRGDHAVEFPARHDHPQGRPGIGRRLPGGGQAGRATPLTALALAVLAEQAGFPAGVFNVVTGQPAAIGGELCANPIVRKLSFTGSTAVGACSWRNAPTIKKLSLERAATRCSSCSTTPMSTPPSPAPSPKYRNTGQTCVCANRLLVQAGIYEEFAAKFAAGGQGQLQVGAGTGKGVAQGR